MLQTKVHHVGLAFTAGGGYATTLLDNDETSSGGVVMGGVTVGGRYSWAEPYLSYRMLWDPGSSKTIQPIKAGIRFYLGRHVVLTAEGGTTIHFGALAIGEGTGAIGLLF